MNAKNIAFKIISGCTEIFVSLSTFEYTFYVL